MSMSLIETREHIAHHGRMQVEQGTIAVKEGNHKLAERCIQRAECAAKGKMLIGDSEARDPQFMYGHEKLITAAHEHGLVHSDYADPE